MNEYLRSTNDRRQRGEAPWDTYPYTREQIYNHPDWELRGMADPPVGTK